MLVFLTTAANQQTIRAYFQSYGAPLEGQIAPWTYAELFRARELPRASFVFADLELLTDRERGHATRIWEQLGKHGCPRLNHPTRSLRRFELLRMLHARGSNAFGVYRLAERAQPARYPVFLRGENDHAGARTPLLRSPEQLRGAIRRWRWRGERLRDKLVTEFCDTADAQGVYRKYGAFAVGERVLARHLFFSDRWKVKHWKLAGEAFLTEELRYVETNPHQRELREIFSAARIDYGRIDYALLDGRIQVWEINTNPTIVKPSAVRRAREAVHARFSAELELAWKELLAQAPPPGPPIPVRAEGLWTRLRSRARAPGPTRRSPWSRS